VREDLGEPGALGGDDEVAAEGKIQPRPGGDPVDRCDRWLRELVEAQRGPTDHAHLAERGADAAVLGCEVRVVARREVGAGTESVAGAGDHEDTIGPRVGDIVEHVDELAPHGPVDGVLLVGSVQRDAHDAVRAFDDESLHAAATVAPWASTRSGSGCGAPPTSSSSSPPSPSSPPWWCGQCCRADPTGLTPRGGSPARTTRCPPPPPAARVPAPARPAPPPPACAPDATALPPPP